MIFYEKYAIYYLPRPDEIIIVRVLHGSRDIAFIADEGGFDMSTPDLILVTGATPGHDHA